MTTPTPTRTPFPRRTRPGLEHLWNWDGKRERVVCAICGTTRRSAEEQGTLDRCPGRGERGDKGEGR